MQPFTIIHPSSWYDWNTVEKDAQSQVIHPFLYKLKYITKLQLFAVFEEWLLWDIISYFTQKEITSQTDSYLVILSSKTYVFENNLTKYYS